MAYNFSRRDFMKGAGITVLAAASAGLFTGCGGEGGGSYVPAGTTTKVDNVNIKLVGYSDGWGTSIDALVSEIVGNYAGTKWISVTFELENNSAEGIKMGNTTETVLAEIARAVIKNDYSKMDELGRADFVVKENGVTVKHADIGYTITDTGTINSYSETLQSGGKGYIKLYCIVPGDWQTLDITYTPSFNASASRSFKLVRSTDTAKV